MMTKKNYIIAVLDRLDGTWELASALKALIEHTDVDDEFISGIAELLMQAIHEVADDLDKEKLQRSHDFLLYLQKKETDESLSADSELDEMLANL